ncbi:MAG: putative 2-aminoethylphosphonate ABC transporter permease subunit [Armatimonadetes bacterium]|nr:putative 2-aminoethylphosphonate ABC transporter permease subunit [Armatimonadota bacterium]MBI2973402.1 putative 2-aminoethylphosphonate ABC transporter permease subunit [Armatimonadota bacterium]
MGIALAAAPAQRKLARDEWIARVAVVALALWLLVAVALPLWALLSKSFQNRDGVFVGLLNYATYFSSPALFSSFWNSIMVAVIATTITLPGAFVYAYALTRSSMKAKGLFTALAQIPILAPSLLPAIALIYLFGNQGLLRSFLFGQSIYGPLGIVIAEAFYTFPHALLILVTALNTSDARLYESAAALGAWPRRIFFTVTLPGARYGILSAALVVFTLVMTDFGAPKVIGGRFNVLATDVYKQVVGQQNFQIGAVVAMMLLFPAILSFAAERFVRRKQMAQLTAQAVPLVPKPNRQSDWFFFGVCTLIIIPIVGILLTAAWASFIRFWPYNLTMGLGNYNFSRFETAGWLPYWNSLRMAGWTALIGTALIFGGAYLLEKTKGLPFVRSIVQLFAMLPLAVPGLVLGISYIFFFNHPANPLVFLYGTLAILVINTIAHFYTVSHLTATTALKQLDNEFEAVSASLHAPFYRTFWKVTVPVCLPAILDIAVYMFVNAMTTVSAVIFLWVPSTRVASIAVVYMDDAGWQGAAAAMAMMIVYTSATLKLVHVLVARILDRRTQAWRRR